MPGNSGADKRPLTEMQAKFVDAYIANGGDGKRAAMAAGYAENSASVTASKLMGDPRVRMRVEAGRERQHGRVEGATGLEITPERVLTELAYIGYADPLEAFDAQNNPRSLKDMPEPLRRAISKIKVRVDPEGARTTELTFWEKPKALEMLGRRLAIFKDRLEVAGEGGEPLQIVVQTYKDEPEGGGEP